MAIGRNDTAMNLSELRRRVSFARTQQERKELLQLSEISPLQISTAWRIWERHAPPKLRGILAGNGWHWDPTIQGYRSADGKVVSGSKLKELALQVSDAVKEDMRKKSHGIGLIPLFIWKHQFAIEVAGLFTLMAMIGAGGAHNLTPKIKKAVVGTPKVPGGLAFSLDRLARWGRSLADDEREAQETGELVEPEGMKPEDRAELYASSAASSGFENATRTSHEDATDVDGKKLFMFERNILSPHCTHCHDGEWTDGCQELTDAGWLPLGSMSVPGCRTCRAACKCRIEYSPVRSTHTNN